MRALRRFQALAAPLFLGTALSACSPNLTRFDLINTGIGKTSSGVQVTRAETADQGSGAAAVALPYDKKVRKVTIGGWYQRRTDAQGSACPGAGCKKVSAGLHGNPLATK